MWNPHFGSCKHVVDGSILRPHPPPQILISFVKLHSFHISWIAAKKSPKPRRLVCYQQKLPTLVGAGVEAPWEKSWQEGNLWQLPVEYTDRKWINKISWIEFNTWDTEVFLWLFDCCFFQYPPCFSNKDKKRPQNRNLHSFKHLKDKELSWVFLPPLAQHCVLCFVFYVLCFPDGMLSESQVWSILDRIPDQLFSQHCTRCCLTWCCTLYRLM